MDVVLRSSVAQEQKEFFNRVRLQLRLLTASDIILAHKSKKITDGILNGINKRHSEMNWPNKMELPNKWYETFNMILRQVIEPQLQSTPLGKWKDVGHQRLQWYRNEDDSTVINWNEYRDLDESKKIEYRSVECDEVKKIVIGDQNIEKDPSNIVTDKIEKDIMNSPQWMKNMWRGNKFEPKVLRDIVEKLNANKLCIAGDGSVRDQLGSYAWCMTLKGREDPFLRVKGPKDGLRHHMRALRAESTHVLASIALISRLEQFTARSMKTV